MANNKDDEILDPILEQIPENERPVARRMLAASMSISSVVSPQAELMKKVTPENISELLEAEKEETRLAYKDSTNTKIVTLISIGIVAIFAIIVIALLKDQPDILKEILIPAVTLIAGAIGGYGYGKTKKD